MSKIVRIDSNGQVYVDRLTEIEVQSSDEVLLQYLKCFIKFFTKKKYFIFFSARTS